jgi:hypothetical protein
MERDMERKRMRNGANKKRKLTKLHATTPWPSSIQSTRVHAKAGRKTSPRNDRSVARKVAVSSKMPVMSKPLIGQHPKPVCVFLI